MASKKNKQLVLKYNKKIGLEMNETLLFHYSKKKLVTQHESKSTHSLEFAEF